MKTTKWLNHDLNYNLLSFDQLWDNKQVDVVRWVDRKWLDFLPADDSNLLGELITMFDLSNNRDNKADNVSSMFYLSHKWNNIDYTSKFRLYTSWVDYMTNFDEFVKIQNGYKPTAKQEAKWHWYIQSNRDLVAVVHKDLPQYRASDLFIWLRALWLKDKTKWFINGGVFWVPSIITQITREVMQETRFAKYTRNRIRPEELAAYFEQRRLWIDILDVEIKAFVDSNYEAFINNEAVIKSFNKYNTYLLPQAYIEGCPLHPDHPKGHFTFARAIVECLKSVFDNQSMPKLSVNELWDTIIQSEPVMLYDELDSFADQIDLARSYAGVHFLQDEVRKLNIPRIAEYVNKRMKHLLSDI